MNPAQDFLWADWPAPTGLKAGTTLRTGGTGRAPFDTLNLGAHVEDSDAVVASNRAALAAALALPSEPVWLDQTHGTTVVNIDRQRSVAADAAVTTDPARVLAVLTADCLPVVFCDRSGGCRGVAHAGWRGLVAGILEATVAAMSAGPDDIQAWLGPAISRQRFEVGAEVRAAFVDRHGDDHRAFYPSGRSGRFLANIYELARSRLHRIGVTRVYGGGLCTLGEPERWFSYRGAARTGRMATLVWTERPENR